MGWVLDKFADILLGCLAISFLLVVFPLTIWVVITNFKD